MLSTRYFPASGTAENCALCECLGLSGKLNSASDYLTWLENANYTHLVEGCGSQSIGVNSSSLKRVQVVHTVQNLDANRGMNPGISYWLVSDRVTDEHSRALMSRDDLSFVWIPRKIETSLAEQVRLWPKELSSRLFIQWPHFSRLAKWGWKWKDVISHQRHLWNAFSHLQWRMPPGWDLHNPEIGDDLEMEPRPSSTCDNRPPSFRPEISVIVPTYNSFKSLHSTVAQVLRSELDAQFEVLVADDGSDDETPNQLRALADSSEGRLVYLRLERPAPRKMGENGFRAGVARNVAATLSRGRILLFLDADILIPPNLLHELRDQHLNKDVIQATRLQLKQEPDSNRQTQYEDIKPVDLEALSDTWSEFQSREWDESPDRWKFTSTFCLSLKREHFFGLGGFRRSFTKYGFEDTDLGYRAAESGLRFHRTPLPVYHFKHPLNRSEFNRRAKVKNRLLRNSARVFFLNNPHPQVLDAIPQYLCSPLSWRETLPW